jgi:hypothetical protein
MYYEEYVNFFGGLGSWLGCYSTWFLVGFCQEWHISIEYFLSCDQNGTDTKTHNIKLIPHPLDVSIPKKIATL